jgi:hypothetical protein
MTCSFSIRKQEDKTLQSLINRVDTAINHIQDLRPKDFTLSNLDDELASMTLIRALPDEFSAFASSLLLLDKLEKSTIHQAFLTEESQRRRRASAAPNISLRRIRHGLPQVSQIQAGGTGSSLFQPLQTQGAQSETSGAANNTGVHWKCKCTVNFRSYHSPERH